MKLSGLVLLLSAIGLRVIALGPFYPAPRPNDPYYGHQWYLENRAADGMRSGVDINARLAWSTTRGEGVTIAIVDNGVEVAHPDLSGQFASTLNWNFSKETADGNHPADFMTHGTPVAGIAAAEGGNGRGITGVAPEARLASWVIYNATNGAFVNGSQMAEMFQFHSQEVAVQNHSWVKTGTGLIAMTAEENLAISNAVTAGRGGKGVVIVRAGGNDRIPGRNGNEDAYLNDPRAIAVAAVHELGRATSYSTPGANLLVAAPSGDIDFGYTNIFSTDRLGQKGYNGVNFPGTDLADYVWGALWTAGTSAAAPMVSGTAALMLSANPELSWRDVQQILVHTSSQTDLLDPTLQTNGAGFHVSHNTGYGLIHAGFAVALAQEWPGRPATANITVSSAEERVILDGGLIVSTTNEANNVQVELAAIAALPSLGAHADEPTPSLPLVDVGQAVNNELPDLQDKGALIQRGGAPFATKLQRVADAGAEFAIMFNNNGGTSLEVMGSTDYITIPAVFISQRDGEALRAYISTNLDTRTSLRLLKQTYTLSVTNDLVCEHVSLRVKTTHSLRGDVRITVVSPQGTRSVLQRLGADMTPGPADWVYTSTQHFYESSHGDWKVEISDEAPNNSGSVQFVELQIEGVPIADSDHDGLADEWEMEQFGSLQYGAKDDPDRDGFTNAREQVLATPAVESKPLDLAISEWNQSHARLSWLSVPGVAYEVRCTGSLTAPFEPIATIWGEFPAAELFLPVEQTNFFFRVRRIGN